MANSAHGVVAPGAVAQGSALRPLDSDTFDEVVYDDAGPCAVLFSRVSCSVCASVRPVVESVAHAALASGSPWGFYVVDAVASFDLVQRLSLAGVPQICLFVDGELRSRLTGKMDADGLRSALAGALS